MWHAGGSPPGRRSSQTDSLAPALRQRDTTVAPFTGFAQELPKAAADYPVSTLGGSGYIRPKADRYGPFPIREPARAWISIPPQSPGPSYSGGTMTPGVRFMPTGGSDRSEMHWGHQLGLQGGGYAPIPRNAPTPRWDDRSLARRPQHGSI